MQLFMNESRKQKERTLWGLTGALLILYGVITFLLFYRQCMNVDNFPLYVSDMKAYMQTALGQESGYEFPYPVFFWLIRLFAVFCPIEVATALVTTLLNAASVVLLMYFVWEDGKNTYLCISEGNGGRSSEKAGSLLTTCIVVLTVCSIFFVSMLYAPQGIYLPGMHHKYLGVFTANPYHNATYLATRPFSILAFFLFLRILDHYEQGISRKEGIGFAVSLLLTTMTKPSFTLVFGMAAAIVLLVRLICSKGSNIKQTARFVFCFVPTILDLLYQYRGVFEAGAYTGEETGIGLGWFSAWSLYCHNIPLAIVLALAFPGLYLVLHLKALKENSGYRFTWLMMICALLSLGLLYEKGERFDDLNFSWGYMHGIFFAFAVTVMLLLRDTFRFVRGKEKQGFKGIVLCLEWAAYLWHLGCGACYFLYLYHGFEHMAF